MATVFLARDVKHDRSVAIKVLQPDLASSLASERFLLEISLAAKLNHPNILTLYDSGEANGMLYYVMPYAEGESLRAKLQREGALSTDEAIAIVRQVADALTYAHGAGVVHRDIKPENILISGGHAVVSDFGIARALDVAGGERLTATGIAIGTPAYMSPEQAAGVRAVDARSDLYSLACVAYEMLGGDPPFTGGSPQALMARHAMDTPLPLRTVRPTLSEAFDVVLEKALAKVPGDRFATAGQLADALVRAHTTGDVKAFWKPMLWLRQRSERVTRVIAVVAVAALALILTRQWLDANAAHVASLTVLPTENLSGDSTQDVFTAGMSDALRDALGQVGALRLTVGNKRFYQVESKADSTIGRELDVDAVVHSSVVRAGDSVHFQVRLVQARPAERLILSHVYDCDIRDVLAMHSEVARDIARGVAAELTSAEVVGLQRPRPVNPAAYEAYLRGMYFLDKRTPADQRRGLDYFLDAVDKNPGDALAWSGLALGYATLAHGAGPAAIENAMEKGRAAALRAVTLDPMLAEAWAAQAQIKTYLEWDWAGAEKAFRRANELNPSLPGNHYHYAWYLVLFDRFDEAIAEHKRAEQLDPFTASYTSDLAVLYTDVGRYDERSRRAYEPWHQGHARALLRRARPGLRGRRMYPEALAALDSAATINPGLSFLLADTYIRAGRESDSRKLWLTSNACRRRPFSPSPAR
jgi:serine/threonine-protein kinase